MRTLLAVLVVALLGASSFIPARADITIGAFSNTGTTCSFSGNTAGFVTAHIVVRTDGDGFRGVRFMAPIPSCFDAVFVQETVPDGLFYIGESQTGISIAIPDCVTLPTRVLDITYYSAGGTTPCCEFPLVADPVPGYLQAVDCSYTEIRMQSVTSYMNADSSCVCSVYQVPPYPPANPYPPTGASWIEQTLTLRWTCADPGALDVSCDLYFGTTPDPPLVAADIPGYTNFSYALPHLSPDTMYYWRIVGRNIGGGETVGDLWQFSTGANSIPVVALTQPSNGSTAQPLAPTLKWTGYDESSLTYDVFLGTDPLFLPKVLAATTATQYAPPTLEWLTTYYWRVTAQDIDGAVGISETWSFTTRGQNLPPTVPSTPSPVNGAGNVALSTTLTWQCSDPEGQALRYDVYLGTATDPPLVASNVSSRWYTASSLHQTTTYYWRIVARDTGGSTTSGPIWSFTTRVNSPPAAPSSPTPSNGSIKQPLAVSLSWNCSDPDGQALRYDVYFGSSSPPPLLASNVSLRTYYPGPQTPSTTLYWRIVARDTNGAETSGPTWSYTTKSADEPPNIPGYPTPGDGAINQPVNTTLKWYATDPEDQPLNFDVYFGTAETPPLVADHVGTKSFTPGLLTASTVYRWRIVSRDPAGQETSGPVWSFRTSSVSNVPPLAPSNPSPANNSTVESTTPLLSWQGGDPDGDAVQYHVFMFIYDSFPDYLGTTNTSSFQVTQPLPVGWNLHWYVTASDGYWYTDGPTWNFTVTGGNVPVAFTSFAAEQSGNAVDVRWELASDEAIESFTLYRRAKGSEPVEITRGRVERAGGSYRDTAVEPGETYTYDLVVQTSDGDEFRSPMATLTMATLELSLHQNVPNPFNPQTSIRFDLPAPAHVRLMIFDVNGRLIRMLIDEDRAGGTQEVTWTGRDDAGNPVSSGVYFYVLESGKQRLTRKLVLLK